MCQIGVPDAKFPKNQLKKCIYQLLKLHVCVLCLYHFSLFNFPTPSMSLYYHSNLHKHIHTQKIYVNITCWVHLILLICISVFRADHMVLIKQVGGPHLEKTNPPFPSSP